MKKILCLILSLIIVVSVFSACSGNNAGVDKPVDEITENTNDEILNDKNDSSGETNEEETKEESQKEEVKEPVKEDKAPVKDPENTPVNPEKSVSEIISEMVGVIPSDQHNLEAIPAELYKDIYGIDKNEFSDAIIYGTMISVKANEIILIKVNNENEIQKAVDALQKRKDQVYKTWEQYLPDQFEMVKNGVIKTNGKYAALIISPEVTKVSNKFMELTR